MKPALDALRSAAASRAFEAMPVPTPEGLIRVAADGVRRVDELAAGGVRVLISD